MKHAYLVTIHSNFKSLNLMLEFLDNPDNDFFILIDKKVKQLDSELIEYIPKASSIILLPRIVINWGGFSQIKAEILLMKAAIKTKYNYYHYVQGSDFPIKTPKEISEFFEIHKGKEFVNFNPQQYAFAHYKCDYYHLLVDNRFYRYSKAMKLFNHGFARLQKVLFFRRKQDPLYHGSALFSITNEFAEFVLSKEKYIERHFKYTLAADEVYLQTLIMGSKFKEQLYKFEEDGSNCYYIDWKSERTNHNSPYTFVSEDFERLINSRERYLFARKFDERIDLNIVQKIFYTLSESDCKKWGTK